jgi:hypothetical protein
MKKIICYVMLTAACLAVSCASGGNAGNKLKAENPELYEKIVGKSLYIVDIEKMELTRDILRFNSDGSFSGYDAQERSIILWKGQERQKAVFEFNQNPKGLTDVHAIRMSEQYYFVFDRSVINSNIDRIREEKINLSGMLNKYGSGIIDLGNKKERDTFIRAYFNDTENPSISNKIHEDEFSYQKNKETYKKYLSFKYALVETQISFEFEYDFSKSGYVIKGSLRPDDEPIFGLHTSNLDDPYRSYFNIEKNYIIQMPPELAERFRKEKKSATMYSVYKINGKRTWRSAIKDKYGVAVIKTFILQNVGYEVVDYILVVDNVDGETKIFKK